jgi:hypothetical protein
VPGPWPCAIPYCKPRQLTIYLIAKHLCRAKSGRKVFDRGVNTSEGRQPLLP